MLDSVNDWYVTQELSDKIISEETFTLKYCNNKYKIQKICGKVVDSNLLASKFVPDWFVTSKMIEKFNSAVFSNDDIDFGDLDSDFVTFFSNDIGLNSIIFDNINLDDDNYFDDFIQKLLIMFVLWLGIIDISNAKHLKKIDEELIHEAWNQASVWNWLMSEDEIKEEESSLIHKT